MAASNLGTVDLLWDELTLRLIGLQKKEGYYC